MRTSEIVASTYAIYIAFVAAVRPWPRRRRLIAWAWSSALLASVVVLVAGARDSRVELARDWAPALFVLFGYYAAGALFVRELPWFERWLRDWDRRLLGDWNAERMPSPVRGLFELVYAGTFLMIPAGYAALWFGGHRADADHYWTIVLLAEFGSFGVLPWLPSRPPWLIDSERADRERPTSPLRRFGLFWVRRTSHCANTFPSGHAAGSLAIALAVVPLLPTAGAALLVIAIAIAIGCVSGRYHYAIDVVAGIALAVAIWAGVSVAGM